MRPVNTPGLIVALAALVACDAGLVSATGEDVLYHHDPGLTPCAGNPAHMDRFAEYVVDQLGVEGFRPGSIEYHWLDREALAAADVRGCEARPGGNILCDAPAVTHEVVHALALEHFTGLPNTFFSEGLAIALEAGPVFPWPTADEDVADPRAVMTTKLASDEIYVLGGSFVSYLLYRHGAPRLVELYAAIDLCTGIDGIRAAFRDVYGLELDAEVEVFRTTGRSEHCALAGHPVIPFDCTEGTPLLPASPGVWRSSGALGCDDPEVVGGLTDPDHGAGTRSWTVEIEQAGTYRLSAAGSDNFSISVLDCSGCPFAVTGDGRVSHGSPVDELHLDTGVYALVLSWTFSGGVFDHSFQLERVDANEPETTG